MGESTGNFNCRRSVRGNVAHHLANAAAIICLHNHPSGNPEPSREDIRITRQLVEAGQLMGVPVHDHLIIAHEGYTSLAERGLMS